MFLMDTKELTKKYILMSNELFQTKKRVDYLTQEFEKLRLLVDDMKIDVKMLQKDGGNFNVER